MRQTCLYPTLVTIQPGVTVGKHLQCVVEGCEAKIATENEEELLKQVATHAAQAHGVTKVDPELLAKVRSAIRDV